MPERTGITTFQRNPLTLLGNQVAVGQEAPDATVLDNNMQPVSIFSLRGQKLIIASVPSLDTPVCDTETRRFNSEASALGEGVEVLTVSMDLPFAQKRWCGAAGIDRVRTLSDHREASFGNAYGVLIKELRLLARAVFVVDAKGAIRYIQIVDDITKEPNYDAALDAVKSV